MKELLSQIREFNTARNWEQFHSPKNLVMALSVEVAEIVEHFQWLTQEQSRRLEAETHAKVKGEIADTLIYLLNLADQLRIDPVGAAKEKMATNELKYPVSLAKGHAKKYNEL